MNERIRELIEQATESTGFLTAGDSVEPLPVREFNKEKFAELIVRECANIAFEEWQHNGGSASGESAILKYFGVEE